ncbi:Protein CBG15478 [Caenorhabditis briggsae]|uniref:Protein CBG15478 n=1 Tax=Caenorhabditis briggsae TaxID=6238 RepID=A8XM78_CAEBR|nr:Protein CBG15478 [Caenorhabditis briggsae]CAP33753.1 Protein CBG15478 [Caenorhabditis briggsae]
MAYTSYFEALEECQLSSLEYRRLYNDLAYTIFRFLFLLKKLQFKMSNTIRIYSCTHVSETLPSETSCYCRGLKRRILNVDFRNVVFLKRRILKRPGAESRENGKTTKRYIKVTKQERILNFFNVFFIQVPVTE